MKIYGCPERLPAPKPDYRHFDIKAEADREASHAESLRTWLFARGYCNTHSGQIVRFPIGDGFALYMLADGPQSFLIHLPYGDGYHYPDAQHLPKDEIIRRIDGERRLADLFHDRTGTPPAPAD